MLDLAPAPAIANHIETPSDNKMWKLFRKFTQFISKEFIFLFIRIERKINIRFISLWNFLMRN